VVKVFLAVAAAFLLILGGAFGFWFYQKQKDVDKTAVVSPVITVIPTPTLAISPIMTPTVTSKTDKELLTEAFAQKYQKAKEQVTVTIKENDGNYVSGGVKFEGEIGGGWFLAAKQNGQWTIVADGNGTVMCSSIESYDFPVSMVPECWDEVSGKLVIRK